MYSSRFRIQRKRELVLIVIVLIFMGLNVILLKEQSDADKRFQNVSWQIKDSMSIIQNHFNKILPLHAQISKIRKDSILTHSTIDSLTLVYVYSDSECSSCIYEDIVLIRKTIDSSKIHRVLVLPIFENNNQVKKQLSASLYGIPYCRLDRCTLDLPEKDSLKHRFFFVLSPDGNLFLPFFPEKLIPNQTELYLRFVQKNIL